MYSTYIKEVVSGLIRSGFRGIQAKNMPEWEAPPLLYAKVESPVFYVISILDASFTKREEYENWITTLALGWKESAFDYGCQYSVCLTLLVDNFGMKETVEYVHNKIFFPGEAFHHIWWYINPQEKTISTAKGQPSKLLNIQDILLESFHSEKEHANNEFISLEQVEERAAYDALPIAKTSNILVTYALLGINIFIFIIMTVNGERDGWITAFGIERGAILEQGELYRFITALFLHGNIFHLMQNGIYLYFFGSRVELLFGKADMVLLYFVSGLMGGVASIFFNGNLAIGASGAVFGLIGAVLSYSYYHGKKNIGINFATLVLLVVVGLLLGFLDTNVDVAAHFGGFIAGMITAGLLYVVEKSSSPQ